VHPPKEHPARLEAEVSFLLYFIGFIVFISGAAWLATLAGLAQTYVVSGALVLFVIAIFTAATRRRENDLA
jgi:apolipoprotein N-acyltransferase